MDNYKRDINEILNCIRSKAVQALYCDKNWTQNDEERRKHHNLVIESIEDFFSKYPTTDQELIYLLNTLKGDSTLALEINWDVTENKVDGFESQLYLIRNYESQKVD